jgi:hypothetical protein
MGKLLTTSLLLTILLSFTHAQIPTKTTTTKQTVTSRPFPSATVFTPSPALQQAFNWWLAVNPLDFGYTYDKVPQRQSFLDSAIYKFYLKSDIQFNGILPSPGINRLQPDSLYHLLAMPNLRDVYLSENQMYSATFQVLAQLPNLRSIGFPLSNIANKPYNFTFGITEKDVEAVIKNTSLENLHLAKCNLLTDHVFKNLTNNKNLKTISLTDCNSLTDHFFLTLEGCSQLETISFSGGSKISMAALNNLRSIMHSLPSLRHINFRAGSTLSSKDLMAFASSCRADGFNITSTW